ncbi:MAG: sodium-extruding oxaloacetate decarboxylase subunit alpha [Gammaproteobacteria bacterium]
MGKPLKITELVLRDGSQSLLATRMRIEDMLPIAEKLDKVGYWSLETWGGATFDACIRYLGEDPWERLRLLKAAMPNTPQQMLLRGQNVLGYRHYADDVIEAFVERAAATGIDVFRIFDAMNDLRNLQTAVQATIKSGKHAQGTISYTISPVHTMDMWVDMARRLEDMGCHSIAIKDMAGLLKPYVAEELVGRIKAACQLPLAMHCHATTGMSSSTYIKAIEAGLDMADTAISSMSMTYGHSPTESLVAMLDGTERSTGLDLDMLEEIAVYFRAVRKKYAAFEGSLKGVDSRILLAQVPGGMLTNLENQLREQHATDKFDAVLEEIPRVRKDLGYIPLVTPTSQIVGTQAVINVLSGVPYQSISKEAAGVLKGEYGATPGPVNQELQQRVLEGAEPLTCRPADQLTPEMDSLTAELKKLAAESAIKLAEPVVDDVLIYAQFQQVGLKFIENRGNPDAFEPHPDITPAPVATTPVAPTGTTPEHYQVSVDGHSYEVVVSPGDGKVTGITPVAVAAPAAVAASAAATAAEEVNAPLSGSIIDVLVTPGEHVTANQVVVVMEAMKMETEIRCNSEGQILNIGIAKGDSVQADQQLLTIG